MTLVLVLEFEGFSDCAIVWSLDNNSPYRCRSLSLNFSVGAQDIATPQLWASKPTSSSSSTVSGD